MASQLDDVLLELREMILNGQLAPGERLAEIPVAERLGVSRTPVRHAFTMLQAEGLIEVSGARSYAVRRFGFQDVVDAIDVRGALEGLAARTVAEHGVTRSLQSVLNECVEAGEAIIGRRTLGEDDYVAYAAINRRLHDAIVSAAGNAALANALSLNDKLPFAAAASVAWNRTAAKTRRRAMLTSQIEHELIVDALVAGEGARVEALMKEHVNVAKNSVRALLDGPAGDVTPEVAILLAS